MSKCKYALYAYYSIHYITQMLQENHLQFDHFSRQSKNEDFYFGFKTWSNVWNISAAQTLFMCGKLLFLQTKWCTPLCWQQKRIVPIFVEFCLLHQANPWPHCWLYKSFHLSILPFWQPGLFCTCPSPCLSRSHLSQSVFLHSIFCILIITWQLRCPATLRWSR